MELATSLIKLFGINMNLKSIKKYIVSDCYRYCGKPIGFSDFMKQYLLNRSFNFMFWQRLCQTDIKPLFYFSFIILNIKRIKYKIDISHKCKIGYGFYLGHSGPIVINPTTIIGNNVNMSQYTSVGANEGEAAIIGDNVYIGPNVCIIENVQIGNNATIGAGSFVTKDIPANATAVGNYAKVINYNMPAKYINNKFSF